jgi:hypothetical protein
MDFICGDRTSIGTPVTTQGVDLSRKIRSGHPPATVLIENAGDFEVEGQRAIGHLSVTAEQTDESCTLLDPLRRSELQIRAESIEVAGIKRSGLRFQNQLFVHQSKKVDEALDGG